MIKIAHGSGHKIDIGGKYKYFPDKVHRQRQHKEFATFRELTDWLPENHTPLNEHGQVDKFQLGYFINGGLLRYQQSGSARDREDDQAGRRKNGNIGDFHFVSYDLDDLTEDDARTIIDELYAAEVEAFYYHTASSKPEAPKLRVLVSISEPLPSDTQDKAWFMLDLAESIWGDGQCGIDGKTWTFCGVQFDKTAFREAQYQIRPHSEAVFEYFDGEPVDVDALPISDRFRDWKIPGVYNTDREAGAYDDADCADWIDWAEGRGHEISDGKIYLPCPNRDSHTGGHDYDTSTAIMFKNGEPRFDCKHDSCDHLNRHQRDTMKACGVPEALLVDAHGASGYKRQASDEAVSKAAAQFLPAKADGEEPREPRPKREQRQKAEKSPPPKADGHRLTGELTCSLSEWDVEALRKVSSVYHLVDTSKGVLAYFKSTSAIGYSVWKMATTRALEELTANLPGVYVDQKNGRFVNAGKALRYWNQAPRYRAAAMLPPPLVDHDGVLNTWLGFACEPKAGDVSMFEDFIYDVLCSGDEKAGDYLMGWLAHMVQRPGEKPGVSLVLLGGEGAGKGTIGEIMRDILGSYYQSAPLNKITGKFNSFIADKILVLADEAKTNSAAQADAIKSLVTELTQTVERKGIDAEEAISLFRLVIASNDPKAVQVTKGSRRFFLPVLNPDYEANNSNPKSAEAGEYWTRFHTWRQRPEAAPAILAYLLQWDLTGFNPMKAPETHRQVDMTLENLGALESFIVNFMLYDKLFDDNHQLTGKVVCKAYCDYYIETGGRGQDCKPNASLSKRMGTLLGKCWGKPRQKGDGQRYYDISDYDEVTDRTSEALGVSIDIWNTD